MKGMGMSAENADAGGLLSGCAALVTGASSGIGAATARGLAGQGAAVVLVARRTDLVEEVAAQIRDHGGNCAAVTADLRDPGQARQIVTDAVGRFGRLDVLVNNAGYAALGPVEEGDPEDWERMVDVNLRAVMHTSQAALPHLLRAVEDGPRGVADVVFVTSLAARVAAANCSVYAATKHAVSAFGESLRQEVTHRGLRVCQVEPGATATEMTTSAKNSAILEKLAPPESWLYAEDIARAISFAVAQPPHASINEIAVRPTRQEA
ncbi:SDR family NAD(P)-dependent oxidoreductase [Streptomyces ipomoeae]|nr:SDR family NAD(P)-dependent oxidoreductase [Streptomyces ipomoeae]